ncbi:MAG: DUF1269 domain-containing protein [Actinomycetota bacterium]
MATTLTVWKFNTPDGAERVENKLIALGKQELIHIHDAAVVSWPEDAKKPKTKQLSNLTGAGAAGGAFWGLLLGVILLVPLFGMALGAAAGAVAGSLANVGIDKDFVESVREKITPGTSALFLMSSDAVIDRVKEALSDEHMELLTTNLSIEDEDQLREFLAE